MVARSAEAVLGVAIGEAGVARRGQGAELALAAPARRGLGNGLDQPLVRHPRQLAGRLRRRWTAPADGR